MPEQLKLCPFCGGEAVYCEDDAAIECCACMATMYYGQAGSLDGAAAWNRRHYPTCETCDWYVETAADGTRSYCGKTGFWLTPNFYCVSHTALEESR